MTENKYDIHPEELFSPQIRNLVVLSMVIVGLITGGIFGWTLHFYIGC